MNKATTNLVLFVVSFGALLLLLLTKLEYVMTYAFERQGINNKDPFSGKTIAYGPEPDAQILGLLMIVLAIGSLYSLVKVVRK